MIIMGGGARSMAVYGIVSIVILIVSYFLIVKPILDTTNNTVNNALQQSNQAIQQGLHESQHATNQAEKAARQATGGK